MAKTAVERLLERALSKIEDRAHWVKGASAKDVNGNVLSDVHSRKACCFCMSGAVNRCTPRGFDPVGALRWKAQNLLLEAIDELYPKRASGSIPSFNDDKATKHAQVVKVFKKAIEAAHENAADQK